MDNSLSASTGLIRQSFTYDADGNMTGNGSSTNTITYDATNHPIAATQGTSKSTFVNDADGNRVGTSINGILARTDVWDPNNPLPQLAYQTGPAGNLGNYNYDPTHTPQSINTATGHLFLAHDGQGSITDLVDQNGALQAQNAYTAFGIESSTSVSNQSALAANPFGYTGQLNDPTISGDQDLRARDYDPVTGRFAGRDPVDLRVNDPYVSAYIYANDGSTYQKDPSGRVAIAGGNGCPVSDPWVEISPHVAFAEGNPTLGALEQQYADMDQKGIGDRLPNGQVTNAGELTLWGAVCNDNPDCQHMFRSTIMGYLWGPNPWDGGDSWHVGTDGRVRSGTFFDGAHGGSSLSADAVTIGITVLMGKEKNFKAHFRHDKRNLLKVLSGNNYRTNADAQAFLDDISNLIDTGKLTRVGQAQMKGVPELGIIYKSEEGIIVVLHQDYSYWTIFDESRGGDSVDLINRTLIPEPTPVTGAGGDEDEEDDGGSGGGE